MGPKAGKRKTKESNNPSTLELAATASAPRKRRSPRVQLLKERGTITEAVRVALISQKPIREGEKEGLPVISLCRLIAEYAKEITYRLALTALQFPFSSDGGPGITNSPYFSELLRDVSATLPISLDELRLVKKQRYDRVCFYLSVSLFAVDYWKTREELTHYVYEHCAELMKEALRLKYIEIC